MISIPQELKRLDENRNFHPSASVFWGGLVDSVSHLAWCLLVVTCSLGPDVSIMINGSVWQEPDLCDCDGNLSLGCDWWSNYSVSHQCLMGSDRFVGRNCGKNGLERWNSYCWSWREEPRLSLFPLSGSFKILRASLPLKNDAGMATFLMAALVCRQEENGSQGPEWQRVDG